MGYPQGYDPYAAQGYAQPGYAPDPYAQPYGATPYAEYGYGAPAYGPYPPGYGQQPRAGGGTAITAAVISLLVSLVALGGIGIGAAVLLGTEATSAADESTRSAVTIALAIGAVPSLLWLLGSILLFRRKTAGRVILILLSTLALLGTWIPAVLTMSRTSSDQIGGTIGGAIIMSAIPLLILTLAAASSTGRWIRAGRAPAYPYY
ncbi:hypothetical protein [Nocardia caishijiensis]|uniref:Uncharacterized protein n=1 Tax=Nocardia caishijiensis TaxID=184756 RepID=A0ABQ6YVL3_9NOCA|nr:hypothetical protein [Nocardia caishijiensis]KAF0849663.1 hypothetical protein FNL39_1011107 [Nocardia caishijiensis]